MRKVLISFLLLILLALFAMMLISGVEVGNFALGYSIEDIINKNAELDISISKLGEKINKEYKLALSNLSTSFDKLQKEKENYEKTVAYMSSDEVQDANKEERYKLDYLWTKIGVNATQNNLILKADLSNGSSGVQNQYNISFTAIGEYLSISEFVYAIEKDDTLGFRIEEFALVPYSEEKLQATFIIKNIAILPESLSNSSSVSTGTVTTNPDGNSNNNGPVRQIGGVTVMSDYNKENNANTNNNNSTSNGNNNTGNTNTNS